jgi:hypothetical protein
MADHVDKQLTLGAIDRERQAWNDLVSRVGSEHFELTGFGGGDWTFKDLVGHLNGWHGRRVARIEAAVRGEPQPPNPWPDGIESVDDINAWHYQQNRGRPASELLDEANDLYNRLTAAIENLPDDALNDPDRFAWAEGQSLGASIVSGGYFEHLHEEHLSEIEGWIARNAA